LLSPAMGVAGAVVPLTLATLWVLGSALKAGLVDSSQINTAEEKPAAVITCEVVAMRLRPVSGKTLGLDLQYMKEWFLRILRHRELWLRNSLDLDLFDKLVEAPLHFGPEWDTYASWKGYKVDCVCDGSHLHRQCCQKAAALWGPDADVDSAYILWTAQWEQSDFHPRFSLAAHADYLYQKVSKLVAKSNHRTEVDFKAGRIEPDGACRPTKLCEHVTLPKTREVSRIDNHMVKLQRLRHDVGVSRDIAEELSMQLYEANGTNVEGRHLLTMNPRLVLTPSCAGDECPKGIAAAFYAKWYSSASMSPDLRYRDSLYSRVFEDRMGIAAPRQPTKIRADPTCSSSHESRVVP